MIKWLLALVLLAAPAFAQTAGNNDPTTVSMGIQNPHYFPQDLGCDWLENCTPQVGDAVGSWEYWGSLLGRTGPVAGMPNGVGVNNPNNWGGDAYASFGNPNDPMVADKNVFMVVSVGLNYPGGPTLDQAAAGAMDANWQTIIDQIVAGGRTVVLIRLGWEETGSWYAWGQGYPGQVSDWNQAFMASFQRAVTVMRARMAADTNGQGYVGFVLNPNGDFMTQGGALSQHYPGDGYVVAVCEDIYDNPQYQGGLNSDGTPMLSDADRFTQYILPGLQATDAFAVAHNLYSGVCEWAAGDPLASPPRENPTYVNKMADWVKGAQSPIFYMGYWASGDPSDDWDFSYLPHTMGAFAKRFGTGN